MRRTFFDCRIADCGLRIQEFDPDSNIRLPARRVACIPAYQLQCGLSSYSELELRTSCFKVRLFPGSFRCILPDISEDEPVGHSFEGIRVEESTQEDSRLGIIFFQIDLLKTVNLLCG